MPYVLKMCFSPILADNRTARLPLQAQAEGWIFPLVLTPGLAEGVPACVKGVGTR